MAFFDDFADVGGMFSKLWGTSKKLQKAAPAMVTGDAGDSMDTALGIVGGETQNEKTNRLNAKAAKEEADLRFGKASKLAGLSYGLTSGGSNLQSLTNQTQKKKSILGNF